MCWACGELQKPSASRLKRMQRVGAELCVCTGCRMGKVKCRGCARSLCRHAMYWSEEPAVSYLGYADGWQPSCAACARGQDRYGQRTRVAWQQFYLYPNGPSINVPARHRRPRYNRRRTA